jgi:hypothetical protein
MTSAQTTTRRVGPPGRHAQRSASDDDTRRLRLVHRVLAEMRGNHTWHTLRLRACDVMARGQWCVTKRTCRSSEDKEELVRSSVPRRPVMARHSRAMLCSAPTTTGARPRKAAGTIRRKARARAPAESFRIADSNGRRVTRARCADFTARGVRGCADIAAENYKFQATLGPGTPPCARRLHARPCSPRHGRGRGRRWRLPLPQRARARQQPLLEGVHMRHWSVLARSHQPAIAAHTPRTLQGRARLRTGASAAGLATSARPASSPAIVWTAAVRCAFLLCVGGCGTGASSGGVGRSGL